jgi:HSP20 family protein
MTDRQRQAIRELMALRDRFHGLIERALLPSSPVQPSGAAGFEPSIDIWEDDVRLIVEIDVPGVSPGNLDLHLEGEELVVTGQVQGGHEEGATYLHLERPRGRFCRRVHLPTAVRGEPSAALRAGVLSVTMTKAVERRHIPVGREGA